MKSTKKELLKMSLTELGEYKQMVDDCFYQKLRETFEPKEKSK